MKNSEYWEKRIANNTWDVYNSLEEKNKALLDMYKEASEDIKNELYSLAEKISHGKTPTRSDFYKFNRLTKLKKNIEELVRGLTQEIEQHYIESNIEGIQNIYNNVMVSMEIDDFSMPNRRAMEQMLNNKWMGSDFSTRLWKNAQTLSTNLNDILVVGITQGKTITEMAVNLSNRMNKDFNICHRLIRTETMHTLNQASLKSYKDAGCEKVQFWAAEDERTCDVCGKMHGRIYKIKDCPSVPYHAMCRCTILPIIEI